MVRVKTSITHLGQKVQIKAGKRKKLITALTMISIIITVVGLTFDFVIPDIAYRFSLDATAGGSIGIIGGADGPTSIFIAGKRHQPLLPWYLRCCRRQESCLVAGTREVGTSLGTHR